MAYNQSTGSLLVGDLINEDDADTHIDFGSDSITLRTNQAARLVVNNSGLTVEGTISGSGNVRIAGSVSASTDVYVTGAVSANTYYGDGSNLTGISVGSVSGSARIYSTTGFETSGYLKVSGSSTFTGVSTFGATTFNATVTASQGVRLPDNKSASFGNAADFRIRHDATNTKLTNATGHILIDNQATSKDIRFILGSDSAATEAVKIRNNSDNNVWVCDAAGNVSGSGKLELVGTGSVSGDFNVTGTFSVGSTAQINNTLTLSGAASEALRITKDDASAREIVFENGGADKVSIYMNSAENFFIRQEDSSKDINLRVGTTNAVVVDGSATEVAFAWDTSHVGISGSGNLKVGGSVSASADVYVTGAVSANTYYGDGSNLTGISAGSVSGSARIYSSTGVETSGYLKVTGSSTLAGITATSYSGSGTFQNVGAATFVNNVAVSGNVDTAGDLTAATITMNGFVVDADGDTNLKSLRVDDGSFIGCDSDTDLMRLATNTLQVNGTVSGSGTFQAGSHGIIGGDLNVSGSSVLGKDPATITLINGMITASSGIYMADNRSASFGDAADFKIVHNATDSIMTNTNGDILIDQQSDGDDIKFKLSTSTSASDVKILDSSNNQKHVFDAVGNISSSLNLQASSASFNGDVTVSGSVRGKMINVTHHAYNTTATSEKFIPWYNLSEANAPNNGTYINQTVAPFDGRLRRVMFRPSGSQGGGATRVTLFKASDQSGLINTDEGGVYVEHVDVTCAGTVSTNNVFNFTGSGHYSAGDAIGVSIDPHANMVEVNVTCIWEYDVFGV